MNNTIEKTDSKAFNENSTRDEIIEQYYPLVRYVVSRMSAQGIGAVADIDDLIGYGTIGLIQAVDRFDGSRGVNFQTYAISRIRGAVIDALRTLDPHSRGARQRARLVTECRSTLSFELGREPTVAEVLASTGLSRSQYRDADGVLSIRVVPLDAAQDDGEREEGRSVAEVIDDTAEFTWIPEHAELLDELVDAIGALPDRERLLVNLHYNEGVTLAEIASILEISESRASQLHTRAIRRLREQILLSQAA